jgi:flagellar basal body P-ring formation protein FlgA
MMRVLLLVLLLAAPVAARPSAVATLSPLAQVTGHVYRLGDLARIECPDDAEALRLGQVVIARTPSAGRSITITRLALAGILKARRIVNVRIVGAASVTVKARTVCFSEEQIRAAARSFLEAKIGDLPGREITTPAENTSIRAMVVPAGRDETLLTADYTNSAASRGEVRITVRAVSDGMPLRSRVVRFLVSARERVLVVLGDVRAGQELSPERVITALVDITGEPTDILTSPDQIRRAVARRSIAAGTVLREGLLKRLPDIRRGELVEIRYRRGALVVTARGVSSSDGRVGWVIAVVNSASGRRVKARVLGPGLVEVAPEGKKVKR